MAAHRYKYSSQEILADLRRVYEEVGRERFSYPLYERRGRYSASVMAQRFGSWQEACHVAGIETVRLHPYWRMNMRPRRALSVTLPCLKCDEPFNSWDPKKNRLCPVCTAANQEILDDEPCRVAM